MLRGGGNLSRKTGCQEITRHAGLDPASINVNGSLRFTPHTSHKFAAFTLAEVLITLGIIGVVAALTLPSLIAKYNEKQTVVKLKKVYSVLQTAFLSAEQEKGNIEEIDLVGFFKPQGAVNLMNYLLPYLKTIEVCSNNNSSCVPSMYYYPDNREYLNLDIDTRTAKFVLADGTIVMLRSFAQHCDSNISSDPKYSKYCAWILVDLNGKAKPNTLGRDLFAFEVFNTGIFPAGFKGDQVMSFDTLCKDIRSSNGSRGFGCTGWVMENENMDYLRCNNLSWEGARTCKEANK